MLVTFILMVVQIVFESFPVSSSGHEKLLVCLRNTSMSHGAITEIPEAVMHALHLPTVCVIALFYAPFVWFLVRTVPRSWPIVVKLTWYTAIADVVTLFFFIFFKRTLVAAHVPLWLGFAITSMLLFSTRWASFQPAVRLNMVHALIIGTVQGISLLPGISRFAAVYGTACWLGYEPRKSFAITWMVEFPLILAASVKGVFHVMQDDTMAALFGTQTYMVIAGATCLALIGMYGSYVLARSNLLWLFGFYMIIPLVLAYRYC